MKILAPLFLAAIGLLLLWIFRHTLGAVLSMGLGKKLARALKANHPQPFAVLHGKSPRQRADALWEVLPPYLLDDDFVMARRIMRELETADPHLAALAELRVAEGEGNAPAAEQAARQLLAHHANNVEYRAILARLLLKRDAAEEAALLLQAGDHSDPVLARVMIEVLQAKGELDRADQLAVDTAEAERRIGRARQNIM